MIENDQWFDIGDEHVTTNVEFLSMDQQGIGNVTMCSRTLFSVIIGERGRTNKPLNDSLHWFHRHVFLSLRSFVRREFLSETFHVANEIDSFS